MTLIVDRTSDRQLRTTDRQTETADAPRRRIDVTDLHTAGIEAFVDESVDTDRVSLEHRGPRTYLVVEE